MIFNDFPVELLGEVYKWIDSEKDRDSFSTLSTKCYKAGVPNWSQSKKQKFLRNWPISKALNLYEEVVLKQLAGNFALSFNTLSRFDESKFTTFFNDKRTIHIKAELRSILEGIHQLAVKINCLTRFQECTKYIEYSAESFEEEAFRQLVALYPNTQFDIVCTSINNITAPLTNIRSITCPEIDEEKLQSILINIPTLEKLNLSGNIHFKQLHAETFREITFYKSLKELNLAHTNITSDDLEIMLKMFCELEELNISYCPNINKCTFKSEILVSKVHKIDASNSSLSSVGLQTVIKHFPKLRILDITNCNDIQKCDFIDIQHNLNIEEIHTTWNLFNTATIQNLLKKCPKLKLHRILRSQGSLESYFPYMDNALLMKRIELKNLNITTKDLEVLLKAYSHATKLVIINCKKIHGITFEDFGKQLEIEEVVLEETSLTSQDVLSILNLFPKLKKLTISSSPKIIDIDLSQIKHKLLIESLDFSYSSLSADSIKAFIRRATCLTSINISALQNIKKHDVFDVNELLNIETLCITYNQLSTSFIQQLLNKCPNLKKNKILNTKPVLGNNVEYIENIVAQETLELNHSIATSQDLELLLNASHCVKKLVIEDCKKIEQFPVESFKKLLGLEEIILRKLNVSSQDLLHILKMCPKLKRLSISYCPKIIDIDLSQVPYELELYSLDFSFSQLSVKAIKAFVQRSTNLLELNLTGYKHIEAISFDVIDTLETLNVSSSSISNATVVKFLKHFPKLKNLIISGCNNLKSLCLDNVSNQIEALDISKTQLSSVYIKHLIVHCTKLRILKMKCCEVVHNDKSWGELAVELGLEEIYVSPNVLTSNMLPMILHSATKLSKISIDGISKNIRTEKELILPEMTFETYELETLLRIAKNLQKLDITKCELKNSAVEGPFEKIDSTLETLTISGNHKNQRGILNFVKKISNLQVLCVQRYTINYGKDIPGFKNLLSFQSFTATKSITPESHINLMMLNNNLTNLSIADCSQIKDIEVPPEVKTALIRFDASNSALTSQSLEAILKASPNLQQLLIKNCRNIADIHLGPIENLPIKRIDASVSKITSKGLQGLLQKCPNLEELIIERCMEIGEVKGEAIKPNYTMKEIRAAHSGLTMQGLHTLLSMFPSAKIIDTTGCQDITNFKSQPEIAAFQVERINFSNTSLSTTAFITALKIYKNLKYVDISGCSKLSDESDPINFEDNLKLEKINAARSSLTTNIVLALCKSSPKLHTLNISKCSKIKFKVNHVDDLFNFNMLERFSDLEEKCTAPALERLEKKKQALLGQRNDENKNLESNT